MSNTSGIPVSKPVAIWNKDIKVNFRDLFKSLGKAAVDAGFGKWDSLAGDAVDTLGALGLGADTGQVAWLLIYRSLMQAMRSLVEGNKDLLVKKEGNKDLLSKEIDFKVLCNRLDKSLQNSQLVIDQNFFERPKDLPLFEVIKTPFREWLEDCGFNQPQAETISNRLPSYFVDALNELWGNHPQDYACLKEKLDTPFTKASEREQRWRRYLAWLQKQVEEPMFLEAFGLKQVYVPLRAYYQRKLEADKNEEFERKAKEDNKYEQIVVDLETELELWLEKGDRNDAIRVISGGPGSGKSSFAKIFAANQAEKGQISVLFIPLHHFDPSDDLVDAVGKFVRDDGFLRYNPLLQDEGESRLLIIFDALDELAMQGKIAEKTAQDFVREVQKKVDRFNGRENRLQVLISGRELVVQANSADFRLHQQILHILPYFVTEDERKNYIDAHKLLEQDQRQLWWQSYGKASGYEYTGLPSELDQGNLTEITAQPLLNYLVALSFVRGTVHFSEDSNLNAIYEDLLKAVYERGWTGYQHPAIQGIEEKDFVRILEEIALVSWHGYGRTTTVKEIENHCENIGLKRLLDIFQEGAKLGLTRLLAAFYFRQSGVRSENKTFEFTHKSFGEYLTARRIVRGIKRIHNELEQRKNDLDRGWDDRQALAHWAILCCPSSMDEYLFNFILDELRLQHLLDVSNWQQTLCQLISFMLRHGMPMELLNRGQEFWLDNWQARNAEEALLAVLNACAQLTRKKSDIQCPYIDSFGIWISRLRGQRLDEDVLSLKYLSFLCLQGSVLHIQDFCGANFEEANLEDVEMILTNLVKSNLKYANFRGANLRGANLSNANLSNANLSNANLSDANLENANLSNANLENANLENTNLTLVNLKNSNFIKANLKRASFFPINIEGADLREANLQGAYLVQENLVDANFEKANFEGANLQGTILEGKELTNFNQDSDQTPISNPHQL
ncbi:MULTISPECIES: pentapeptide repeat-containing protein [Nostoc]|uniref:Pentapeptide repeat-containing protein n=2 Tax=Nostoc TaxID=1177 RepID=A0ABR8IA46_9NOSO|nr:MULTISPECIES: pentapeptide repeat-containing protein [Nostoc]MBD2562517.1 pentapeptide repeat-containing protein [Nostoc linckia FACHB-391]MBD2647811.1 pentapeptide repeat-containing protein [Nostoc foliaceum FACHB-393]